MPSPSPTIASSSSSLPTSCKIETTADAAVYKPGAEARIRFHVTNAHGEGVSAALGLQIVDEAVFALAEKQPGFAKVFFYLEQEVMKPRYEIHSLSMPSVIDPLESRNNGQPNAGEAQHTLAARALFSATEMAMPDEARCRVRPQSAARTSSANTSSAIAQAFTGQVRQLAETLSKTQRQPIRITKTFAQAFAKLAIGNGR